MRTDRTEVVESNTDFIPILVDISSDTESDTSSHFFLTSVMSDELSDTNSEMDPSSDAEKCKCMQATCNVSPFLIYSEFVGIDIL